MTATNPWIPLFLTGENIQIEPLAEFDAQHFLQKAEKAIDSARNEATYGKTISELLSANDELKDCHRSLATIGVWHFECAVELFEKAVRNFEKAKKHGLSQKERNKVEAQIEDCKYQLSLVLVQAESAKELLNSIKN